MYTFIILAAFFLLLSGIIFKKEMKKNQLAVVFIVFIGTFIGSIIINGILGSKIPYTKVVLKEKNLHLQESYIITPSDTIVFESYVGFKYKMREDSSMKYNSTDVGGMHDFIFSKYSNRITVNFLPEGDTIPYFKIIKDIKLTNSKWITQFGLPRRGDRVFEAYVPNDSIHNILIDQLNQKFFKNEKTGEEIAKLD